MSFLGRIERHADLMGRMARGLGLDLTDEVLNGRLPAPDLRGLVLNCAGCSRAEACGQFLDAAEGGQIEAAPGYCRNRATLDRLAALR